MADITVKCPNCGKGYNFKEENKVDSKQKSLLPNKINLSPKIHCKCGNNYVWNQAKHTFLWSMPT